MSHLNHPGYQIARAFCVLLLTVTAVHAEDLPGKRESLQPRSFETAIQNAETSGWQQVRRIFVTCGTNEFVFVSPHGLVVTSTADKLALVSADATYFLAFRILAVTTAEPNLANTCSHREFLLDQYPNAKVLEEFSKTVAGKEGPAYDLQVKIAGATQRAVSVALIPCPAGILEFSLNADLSKSSAAKAAFNFFLRTFRTKEQVKLEITPKIPENS